MSHLKGGLALISKAHQELSYSTQPQAVTTEVARNPATQYLNLNSADRQLGQLWNNFTLQKQESLMNAFATRVLVSEIFFPWYIPNVNPNNSGSLSPLLGATQSNDFIQLGIKYFDATTGTPIQTSSALPNNIGIIDIPVRFYTPTSLLAVLNNNSVAQPVTGSQPVWAYDDNTGKFSFLPSGNVVSFVLLSGVDYENIPTLFSLLGFPPEYLSRPPDTASTQNYVYFSGVTELNPTKLLYTSYVDIVSNKSNQYSNTRDGTSDAKTSTTVLCRVFCGDEVSLGGNGNAGWSPFIIHRQFKNPKSLMWNKDSVVDWLDISVYDEWGYLVPLPINNNETVTFNPLVATQNETTGSYPDFQLTLFASEN